MVTVNYKSDPDEYGNGNGNGNGEEALSSMDPEVLDDVALGVIDSHGDRDELLSGRESRGHHGPLPLQGDVLAANRGREETDPGRIPSRPARGLKGSFPGPASSDRLVDVHEDPKPVSSSSRSETQGHGREDVGPSGWMISALIVSFLNWCNIPRGGESRREARRRESAPSSRDRERPVD